MRAARWIFNPNCVLPASFSILAIEQCLSKRYCSPAVVGFATYLLAHYLMPICSIVVGRIEAALDQRLGRTVARASVYNLLHRLGWRKPTPNKRHPQSDPLAQEEWGKNSPKRSTTSAKIGRKAKPSN